MKFTITEQQEQIKNAARDFFESTDAIEQAKRQLDGEDVVNDVWTELCQVDYPAITIPFEHDGVGDDILTAVLLLEEAGRCALPGPLPGTIACAVPLIDELGTSDQKAEQFEAILDENRQFSLALYESGAERLPEDIQLGAERTETGYRLSGTKTLVPYGGAVDQLIVAARTQPGRGPRGITLFLVDPNEVVCNQQNSLDATRPYFELTFEDVEVPETARLGPLDDAGPPLERALDQLRVAICAMMIGGASRVVELSVEQGKEREQFGHPVGRYQAVKHRIADMWMDVEAGRSLVYYAAWALSSESSDAPRAVSAAKSFCSDRVPPLIGNDIQNQGAMGTTWDHDAHIYLKQAKAFENYLGSPSDHRSRLAEMRDL